MQEIRVESSEDLLRVAKGMDPAKHCFRGHSSDAWDLVPTIYRGIDTFAPPFSSDDDAQWVGQMEHDIYRNFRDHAKSMGDEWTRLFVAQHHGVPTRLLDWTTTWLAAAFFACFENHLADGAIWAVDVSQLPVPSELGRRDPKRLGWRLEALQQIVKSSELSFFLPRSKSRIFANAGNNAGDQAPSLDVSGIQGLGGFLVMLAPDHVDDRITRQRSLFSVYVSYSMQEVVWNHREYLDHARTANPGSLLTKIVIPSTIKSEVIRDFKLDPQDYFADMIGLAMKLRRQRDDEIDFVRRGRKRWP